MMTRLETSILRVRIKKYVYARCAQQYGQRPATHREMLHQVVSLVALILHLTGSTNSALLPRAQRSGFGSAEHVIIFGCDGFGICTTVACIFGV